ncbi:MAG: nucleotidyltransferase family protein [Parvibaculaceae bacterium]
MTVPAHDSSSRAGPTELPSRLESLAAAWPDRRNELLLRAALCEPAPARRSWDEWKSQNALDEATWEDHKLLAVVAARLPRIDPEFPDARRLQGLLKALWSRAQINQQFSLRALDILIAAQIPVLLLKGPAFDLAAPSRDRRRLSGDLDIMVRRRDLPRALSLLIAREWGQPDFPLARALQYVRVRPGINLAHKDGGDIDVHHQPIHLRWMSDRALERLWQRARPASFGGRNIFIPSDADLLCISASHGLRRKGEMCHGAWAMDFHHILTAPDARLQSLPEVADELGVAIHVLSALLFLRQTLGIQIDPHLLAALERRSQTIGARMRYYAGTPARSERHRMSRRWVKRVIEAQLALLGYCFGPHRHLQGKIS